VIGEPFGGLRADPGQARQLLHEPSTVRGRLGA
jgi:hypothetical protein